MLINTHAHTFYSDGKDSVAVMALECQRLGLSACVITDHYNPVQPKGTFHSLCKTSFEQQRKEAMNFRRYTKYNIIQGIELNLGYEEILVFGVEVIREIMNYALDKSVSQGDYSYWTLQEYIDLIHFINERKNRCACILCHPNCSTHFTALKYYEALYPILDGYETFNHGINWFKDRNIPEQLLSLKQFDNSDAHWYQGLVHASNNEHIRPIRNEAELIKYIKGKRL